MPYSVHYSRHCLMASVITRQC